MLPNLAAARVANLFDLKGPNMVIDAASRTVVLRDKSALLSLNN